MVCHFFQSVSWFSVFLIFFWLLISILIVLWPVNMVCNFRFEVSFIGLSIVLAIYCYATNFPKCSSFGEQTFIIGKISEHWKSSSNLARYFWLRIFHDVTVKLLIGALGFTSELIIYTAISRKPQFFARCLQKISLFLSTWTSPKGCLWHGSWYPPELVIWVKQKPQFFMTFGSDMPFLLPYYIGHAEQPWYTSWERF